MVREKSEGSFAKVLARDPRLVPSRAWAASLAGPLGLLGRMLATGPFCFLKHFLFLFLR